MNTDLIYRLRKRAQIRRQISTRKSVQEGAPDRIADLLEEAADEIEHLQKVKDLHRDAHHMSVELSRKAYNEQYDAYYNTVTKEWLEPRCEDPACEYCSVRPSIA